MGLFKLFFSFFGERRLEDEGWVGVADRGMGFGVGCGGSVYQDLTWLLDLRYCLIFRTVSSAEMDDIKRVLIFW